MPLPEQDAFTILESEANRAQIATTERRFGTYVIRAMQRAYDLGMSDGEHVARIQAETDNRPSEVIIREQRDAWPDRQS